MNIQEAIIQRRSIRRFRAEPVPDAVLREIAEVARLSPTGINLQPLQFVIVKSPDMCSAIFPHTRWAKLIADGSAGPDERTQPTAYAAILVDTTIAKKADADAGAAAMSMMIAAQAHGVSSCWLANVDRRDLLELLKMDSERFALHTVVAFGYPAMASRAVPMVDGNTAYYLDSPDMLYVPKRAAKDVIHYL